MAKQTLKQWLEDEQVYVKPRTKCKGCGATVAQIFKQYGKYAILDGNWLDSGGDYDTAIDESKEGWYCHPCLEYDQTEPKAVATLHDDEIKYSFGIGGYAIYERGDDEVPGKLFEDVIRPYAKKLTWHSTDPWRGYYESKFNTSWVKVIDDWFGSMDGHNINKGEPLGEFHRAYQEEHTVPNCPMLVAFPRTSNVCSCGIEVYVPKDKIDTFYEWLGIEPPIEN